MVKKLIDIKAGLILWLRHRKCRFILEGSYRGTCSFFRYQVHIMMAAWYHFQLSFSDVVGSYANCGCTGIKADGMTNTDKYCMPLAEYEQGFTGTCAPSGRNCTITRRGASCWAAWFDRFLWANASRHVFELNFDSNEAIFSSVSKTITTPTKWLVLR